MASFIAITFGKSNVGVLVGISLSGAGIMNALHQALAVFIRTRLSFGIVHTVHALLCCLLWMYTWRLSTVIPVYTSKPDTPSHAQQ